MSYNDAVTLFHEFGHGLQWMLTDVDHGMVSGINNVEWDAVELPSQFMEVRPSRIPSLCTHFTRAGIEWRR